MRKTTLLAIVLIGVALIASGQEPAKTPERNAADVKFADTAFARLSFLEGKAFVQRASDLAYEDLQVNMPVAAGDRLGTAEGRAELHLAGRNYVRLDQNAKLDVLNLPRKSGEVTRLRGWAGSFYLDLGGLTREKDVEFLTSDVTLYVLENGLYRIDVRENRETEIMVFSGVVEASGEEGSVLVKKDQRLTIADGRIQGKPSSFFAAPDDAFDRFNESRDAKVGRPIARAHLTPDLEEYEGELDEYGDWAYENPFGYVWVPRGLDPGWMPYTNGRWTWLSMAGWCWLPYEPWGWSTFHYGRWHWGLGRGWYWIPMSGWGPGWVNWWWDDSYYAWAPMSYWGYPGIIIDNFYMGRGWNDYRNYPLHSRALTVIRKDQLAARDIHSVVLRNDAIKSIGKMSLGGSLPDVRPGVSPRISTESLGGGGRVILRRGGETGDTSGGGASKDTSGTANRSKSSTQGGERVIDSKSGSASSAGKSSGTVTKGESAPPAKSSPPPERRIRKKEGEGGAAGAGLGAGLMGYPSRMAGAQGSSVSGSSRQDSGSVLDRLYRSITRGDGNGSSSSRGTVSRGSSSSGSGSSVSSPRAMPRASSSTSSTSSSARSSSSSSSGRSASSGSSSSGRSSGGGSVRKK